MQQSYVKLFCFALPFTASKSDQKSPPTNLSLKIIVRQLVDESHPVVQQLLEADFDLDKSIDAVQQHGELGPAMDYIIATKDGSDEGDLFGKSQWQLRKEIINTDENRCVKTISVTALKL